MTKNMTLLVISAAMVLGGCGASGTQKQKAADTMYETETVVLEEIQETKTDKASVETEEGTETRENIRKNIPAGPELEAYANRKRTGSAICATTVAQMRKEIF